VGGFPFAITSIPTPSNDYYEIAGQFGPILESAIILIVQVECRGPVNGIVDLDDIALTAV
jgi:hypothetical protein